MSPARPATTRLPRPVRYRCDLACEVQLAGGDPVPARLLELSETGGFLEDTALDLQPGDEAVLGVALPGGAPWVCTVQVLRPGTARRELRVARVDHVTVLRRGQEIRFRDVPEDDLERLRGFLELLDLR